MLFRNTAAQSVGLLTTYLFSFILAPLMLAQLSLAEFGVWAVTGAVATYAGLADLGITRSISRFVALYDIRGDERGIAECVGLGLIVMTTIAVLALGGAILAAPLFSAAFGVLTVEEMRVVLLCSVGIFLAQSYRKVFGGVALGLRRMVPPNVASVISSCINFSFSVAALLISPNLVDYALANVAAEVISIGVSFAALLYVWRPPPVAWPSMARTREVLLFSLKNQVSWAAELVNAQSDKIVLAFLIDIRTAGAYEIGNRVVQAVRAVADLTTSALIPTATAHIATHGREALAPFYRRYLRLTVALAFPIFAVCCVSTPFLLAAWLGDVPGDAEAILVLLAVGGFVRATTGAGTTVAIGEGRPGLAASYAVIAALLNIAFTLALAPLFGLWGVLAGTVLGVSGSVLLYVRRFHRVYDIPLRDYVRAVGPPALLSVGLAAPLATIAIMAGELAATRATAAPALAAVSGLYLLAYWLVASRLGFLPAKLTAPLDRRRLARQPAAS